MEKVASAFIALILINVLCTAWTLKTPVTKSDGNAEASLNAMTPNLIKTAAIVSEKSKPEFKPFTGMQTYGNDRDTFIVNKKDTTNKVPKSKRNKSIQKKKYTN